ncbi:MAG: hypothetical protein ACREH5_09080 [Candidatus Omnitrophota bacterium]
MLDHQDETETMLPNGRRAPVEDADFQEAETENLPAQVSEIMLSYRLTAEKIKELKEKYSGLSISGPKDKGGYEMVRAAKSEVTTALTDLEADRKAKKAESLKYGRNVDRAAQILESHLLPLKEELTAEKARIDAEIQAEKDRKQAEINALVSRRIEAMTAVNAGSAINPMELPGMAEADFQAHLSVATAKFQKAEDARIAQEAELLRLRKAEEEAKAKEAAALEVQRKEMDAKQAALDAQRKEQEAREAKIRAEETRIEREAEEKRRADELKAAEEKAAAEARENALREAAEKSERDAKAREAKAEADRKEAEAKAKAEAEEKAKAEALRPDKDKILAYLGALRDVPIPKMATEEGKKMLADLCTKIKTALS